MKQTKWIVMCVMLLLLSGCFESLALVGAGAAGGITVDHLLRQAQEDVQEDIQILEQQNAEYEQQLEQTADEAEKEIIREKIKANQDLLEKLIITELTLQGGREGLKVDWESPEAVTLFATTVLGLLMAYLQWKKKQKALVEKAESDTALEEVVVGGESFKEALKGSPAKEAVVVSAMFKESHGDKQSALTKEKVAVIKARH